VKSPGSPGPVDASAAFGAFWSRLRSSRHLRADLALLAVTLVWGSTFVLMQESLRVLPPYRFLAFRFGVASLVLLALYGRRLWRAPRRQVAVAAGIGATLFVGYASQTIGLQFTTAARSGFVTGLAVVLVPVIGLILLRQRPPLGAIAGVVLATAGLFFLSWPGWEGTSAIVLRGDLITLVCSVTFAVQIVLVGKYAPAMDPMALATAQLLAVTLLSGMFSLGESPTLLAEIPAWVWASIVFLGVAATALAFAVQSKAQRFTTPTHVALIFAMEPVFSAIFAWLLTGEVLTGRSLVGCVLILSGMIVAETRSP
jgi:drug/metabolite transporter (DMT)-like permease